MAKMNERRREAELLGDGDDGRPEAGGAPEEPGAEDDDTLVLEVVDEDVDQVIAEAMAATDDDEVAKLRAEIAELRDQSIRTLADFDNFRKRAERDKQELRRYALLDPLRELLEVVDNLERAMAADGRVEDLKLGVEMTLQQLRELMRRHGVREVPAAGAQFDPSVHEAVSRHEDPQAEVPVVADELQRGYLLHDRLLRPAMVRVAMPVESAGADEPADGE